MSYAFSTGRELIALCEKENLTIAEVMIRREAETSEKTRDELVNEMFENLLTMQKSIRFGLEENQQTVTGLAGGNAEKLIHDTLDTFQRDRFHPYCEDNLILTILESKRMLAEQSGIHVDYKIFLPDKSVIQPSDLSSVLFNILDNAIEACRSTAGFDKHLSLSLTTSKGFLSILVRNTKDPQTVFNHSTTKKNSVHHGLGLSIIEDICRKYDGSWQWNDCGNTFESVILLRYC